jgi:hypothetical protein
MPGKACPFGCAAVARSPPTGRNHRIVSGGGRGAHAGPPIRPRQGHQISSCGRRQDLPSDGHKVEAMAVTDSDRICGRRAASLLRTPNTRPFLMAGMPRLVSAEYLICAQMTEPFRGMAVRVDGRAHQGGRAGRDLSSGRPRRGSVLWCSGRANHRDSVTPPHLPGGKPGGRPGSRQEICSGGLTGAEPAWVLPGEFQPKGDPA